MSKSVLEKRLTRQLARKGGEDAASLARRLLVERGHVTTDGALTKEGKARQEMGNDGRAKDRAAKRSGRKASEYDYNPRTNRATLKKT